MADLKASAFAALEVIVRLFHNEEVSRVLTENIAFFTSYRPIVIAYKTKESFCSFAARLFRRTMPISRFNKEQHKKLKGNI